MPPVPHHRRARTHRLVRVGAAASLVALAAAAMPSYGATPRLRFAKPVVVDDQLAGGEPSIFWDPRHQDFIYSSHEGTTHTLRDGLAASNTVDFLANYRNQVNIWTSKDGTKWSRVNLDGTGFEASPTQNSGFSDPDLTQDAGGRVYNTGINLANDALFSSADGGRTWDRGTLQCHDGDRPWLAAGPKDTVWLATDPAETDHSVYQSTDGGSSCGSTGFADPGGYGKLFYISQPSKALHGALVEPVPSIRGGIGVGILRDAVAAYKTGKGAFHQYYAAPTQGELTHFPSLAVDSAGTLYLTWADYPGGTAGTGKNTIWLTSSKDGVHWTKRYAVAHPGSTVLWPWIAAGRPGSVSVVWYQYDRPTPDPDTATTGNVSVMAANLYGVGSRHVTKYVADASGGPIHVGGICQGGTTCVATGQDRRLGDYFTNWVDARGCVVIATGATTIADPVTGTQKAWSTPLFLHQNGGPSLTGRSCAPSGRSAAGLLPARWSPPTGRGGALGVAVLLLIVTIVAARRRSSLSPVPAV
jgi:hypothetical protein